VRPEAPFTHKTKLAEAVMLAETTLKVAVPLAEGRLCDLSGYCEHIAVIRVERGSLSARELLPVPPMDRWFLPRWLGDMGVNLVISSSMGRRAMDLFAARGIDVIIGRPQLGVEDLVRQHLAGTS
jgi:ATP-binding protein involved in chromosome partitioning